MRIFAIIALIAVASAAPALAQGKPAKKLDPAAKAQPETSPRTCAEYGAGFVRVEGTGTCVKIGGYFRMQGSTR